jgi:hypothetical protein
MTLKIQLGKMCLVYILPLFEYACEVWDYCGIGYSDKLEKFPLDAQKRSGSHLLEVHCSYKLG